MTTHPEARRPHRPNRRYSWRASFRPSRIWSPAHRSAPASPSPPSVCAPSAPRRPTPYRSTRHPRPVHAPAAAAPAGSAVSSSSGPRSGCSAWSDAPVLFGVVHLVAHRQCIRLGGHHCRSFLLRLGCGARLRSKQQQGEPNHHFDLANRVHAPNRRGLALRDYTPPPTFRIRSDYRRAFATASCAPPRLSAAVRIRPSVE